MENKALEVMEVAPIESRDDDDSLILPLQSVQKPACSEAQPSSTQLIEKPAASETEPQTTPIQDRSSLLSPYPFSDTDDNATKPKPNNTRTKTGILQATSTPSSVRVDAAMNLEASTKAYLALEISVRIYSPLLE